MRLGSWIAVFLMLPLFGCGSFSTGDGQHRGPTSSAKQTLGDVYFEPLPLDHTPLEQPKTETMRDSYKALLEIVGDPQTKQIVQYRLADLEVSLAEQKHEEGLPVVVSPSADNQEPQQLFDFAIEQYQQLLVDHPQNPENVDVLYQLAKAYEQQGQMQQSFAALQQLLQQFPNNH